MLIPVLISKIHKATVTSKDLDYSGSISIDPDIIESAKLREFQKVEIYNITNGNRFATYLIPAEKGSRDVIINGAAAHLVNKNDRIIIAAYGMADEKEFDSLSTTIVIMGEMNEIERIITGSL